MTEVWPVSAAMNSGDMPPPCAHERRRLGEDSRRVRVTSACPSPCAPLFTTTLGLPAEGPLHHGSVASARCRVQRQVIEGGGQRCPRHILSVLLMSSDTWST